MNLNYTNKNIIIAPLDWGLGHAARCIPLIIELQKNNKVTVAVTPKIKNFILKELPNIVTVEICSYNISYSKTLPVWLKILLQYFKIRKAIYNEQQQLKQLIKEHNFDFTISDNRFGFRSKDVPCVIITHQINIKSPVLQDLASKINANYLNKFDNVWILDNNTNLAGDLSKGNLLVHGRHYFGTLSRLKPINKASPKTIDVLILLSGTEPQRSVLEQKLLSKFATATLNIVLIRGTETSFNTQTNITTYNLINSIELNQLIEQSKNIICRSGYSTLMDLYAAKFDLNKLILIPTPGQTEQEYLATHWQTAFNCRVISQANINNIVI